ncbi:tetratricopeptide repeat protein [Aliterella atlantica]|uniref:Uncharacterized protein n=1 Tax=Aliterella atlantica CENA595 TaxID=1618023 RepID=A0A0D8ZRI6_9CYAN|nr:tetratricopeptide repeat protein [Aliterella atlantica]KJH71418.1 hypothetical protein UH38_12765 [Aliterella atlantica CENA595]
MDNSLPIAYLSILLLVLLIAGIVVFRQVLKTRKTENNLGRLQKKLNNEKGTVQEYYELGSIYLEKKLYAQAIALFQKALKAAEQEEENVAPIYNGLGYAAFCQEQYDLAIRHYKDALKLKPDYIVALNNLGHAYEKKNLTAPALETYEQVLKAQPNNVTAKRRAETIRKRLVTSNQ